MKSIFYSILFISSIATSFSAFADEKEFYSSPMQILRDRESAEGQPAEMTAAFSDFISDSGDLISFYKTGVFINLIHQMDVEAVKTFVLDHKKGDNFRIKFDITRVIITPQGLKMIMGNLISMEPTAK